MQTHYVEFRASGRGKAQCPPDPAFPDGIALDACGERPGCHVDLPYPAPECGHFVITCVLCRMCVAVTAAGRPDDPVSVRIPCDMKVSTARPDDPAKRKQGVPPVLEVQVDD